MEKDNLLKENLNLLQLVSFKVGSEEYGIEILKVQEIIRIIDITHVPNSPDFVEGVINLRGKVIPIIDLRIRLGMNKAERNSSTRIIVVEVKKNTLGFIVDSVNEVLRISSNIAETPPSITENDKSRFITSICKLNDRLLLFLDLEKILSDVEEKLIEPAM